MEWKWLNQICVVFFSFQAPDCLARSKRTRRDTKDGFEDGHPATIEVYSGLYVNENAEIVEGSDDSVFAEKVINSFLTVDI